MQARRGHGCERTKPRKQSLQRSLVHVRRYAADPHDASLDRLVLLLSRDAHSFLAQRLADGVLRQVPPDVRHKGLSSGPLILVLLGCKVAHHADLGYMVRVGQKRDEHIRKEEGHENDVHHEDHRPECRVHVGHVLILEIAQDAAKQRHHRVWGR